MPPDVSRGISQVLAAFISRGDLAHLALVLWAGSATALCGWAVRELAASNRRFNEVVVALLRLVGRS